MFSKQHIRFCESEKLNFNHIIKGKSMKIFQVLELIIGAIVKIFLAAAKGFINGILGKSQRK